MIIDYEVWKPGWGYIVLKRTDCVDSLQHFVDLSRSHRQSPVWSCLLVVCLIEISGFSVGWLIYLFFGMLRPFFNCFVLLSETYSQWHHGKTDQSVFVNQTHMFYWQATLCVKLMMTSLKVTETSVFYHLQQSLARNLDFTIIFLLLSLSFFWHHRSDTVVIFLAPINPLTPEIDQHLISPYNITPESHMKVTRKKEMITGQTSS